MPAPTRAKKPAIEEPPSKNASAAEPTNSGKGRARSSTIGSKPKGKFKEPRSEQWPRADSRHTKKQIMPDRDQDRLLVSERGGWPRRGRTNPNRPPPWLLT